MTLYKNEIERVIESLNKTILPAKRNDIQKILLQNQLSHNN